jgi:Ca-activated chloride channel family protein
LDLRQDLQAADLKRSLLQQVAAPDPQHAEHQHHGGEEDDLAKLTRLVEESNIALTVLALGTTRGTTVTKEDGTLLKDKEGQLVISRINPLLKSLASSVSGVYITPSNTVSDTAEDLSAALEANEAKAEHVQKMQRHYLELYQIPLALALLLFFMLHTRAVKYLFLLFALVGLPAQASMLDDYRLTLAYKSYQKSDFNSTRRHLKQIQTPSLQSRITLANTYYRQGAFKQAIKTYRSIRSTSPSIKQALYYNIANAYAMLKSYDKAKIYYTKTLQLGADADAEHNLGLVALLSDKKSASLGIAHPKSQDSSSSKSENQEEDKEETRSEDDPSSGSGGGGESQRKKDQEKKQLLSSGEEEQHPLSSKVYELINKGYIREKQPW